MQHNICEFAGDSIDSYKDFKLGLLYFCKVIEIALTAVQERRAVEWIQGVDHNNLID